MIIIIISCSSSIIQIVDGADGCIKICVLDRLLVKVDGVDVPLALCNRANDDVHHSTSRGALVSHGHVVALLVRHFILGEALIVLYVIVVAMALEVRWSLH